MMYYSIAAVVYYAVSFFIVFYFTRKNLWKFKMVGEDFAVLLCFGIFLPVVGWIIYVLDIILPANEKKTVYDYCPDDLQDKEHREQSKEDKDIISLQDALLLADSETKQKMIMQVMTNNDLKNIPFLKQCLTDPDVDTVHYAASALLEPKKGLTDNMRHYEKLYAENQENIDFVLNYLQSLQGYMQACVIDKQTLKIYKIKCVKVLLTQTMPNMYAFGSLR